MGHLEIVEEPKICIQSARTIANQFPGLGCIDDLTTECSLDSQATWVIDVLGFGFNPYAASDQFCKYKITLKSQKMVETLAYG